jgi:nuclear pore complex protein Nup54
MSGLFGNTTSTGGFGTLQQPQQPTGGLFGNTAPQQNTATPSPFGNTATQPAQNNTTPSLFGNTATQPAQNPLAPSLFGNTNANTNTAPSGTAQTGGGLFGAAPNQGNSLFGSSTQQQGGGGLFGASNQGTGGGLANSLNTGGSLFGGPQPQQQATAMNLTGGGGLFGGGTTATNTSGGGLFGNKPTGNIFGNVNAATSNTSNQGSIFSGLGQQPQQNAQQPQPANLFAQPSQQQQQQRPLFGTSQNQSNGSLFSGTLGNISTSLSNQNSLLFSRSAMQPAQQQQDAQTQFAALLQRIQSIAQAWNKYSPHCRFQVRILRNHT